MHIFNGYMLKYIRDKVASIPMKCCCKAQHEF